jgi:hypothetical protein
VSASAITGTDTARAILETCSTISDPVTIPMSGSAYPAAAAA